MSAHDDYLDPDIHLWPETCPECENLEIKIEELQDKINELTAALESIFRETDKWICCHDVNQIAKEALKQE
jgi:archaellum component FlaC